MQKNLIRPLLTPNTPLQLCHRLTNTCPHIRRATNKNTRTPAKPLTQVLEQERNIRTPVLRAPAILLLDRSGEEGEAHEVLLELRWRGGEAEVEALDGLRGDL